MLTSILGPTFLVQPPAGAALCPQGSSCFPGDVNNIDIPACGTPPGLVDPPPLAAPLDAISDPILTTVAPGPLPGYGEVTPTGEYAYRIPIDVPEGRAGMQPALALAYASRGRNGHLGVGFRLEGISEIRRCPKTLATEGKRESVHIDETDAYCLDGHKLIAIQGAYGANGTEYRTEDETFTKVVGEVEENHLARFHAFRKDGRVLTYEGLRVLAGDTEMSFSFPVAEEADRAGNAIRYSYGPPLGTDGKDFDGEYYPTRIDYTFQTQNPSELARRSVRFVYEDRPDHVLAQSGMRSGPMYTRVTKRLETIELDAPSPAEPALAWRYELMYQPSDGSGRSLLWKVRKCGAQGGCTRATTFDWEQTAGPTYTAEHVASDGLYGRALVADLDGDGKDELLLAAGPFLYLHATADAAHPLAASHLVSGAVTDIDFDKAQIADLDGDGRAEIVAPNEATHRFEVLSLATCVTSDTPALTATPLAKEPYDPTTRSKSGSKAPTSVACSLSEPSSRSITTSSASVDGLRSNRE